MYTLTIKHPMRINGSVVGAGEWILNDLNAFEMAAASRPPGSSSLEPFRIAKKPEGEWEDTPDESDRSNRPILIVRSGVIGDLLFLSPVLREMKKNTGKKIALCTWPKFFSQFEGCDFIEELVAYPIKASSAWKFSEIICTDYTMELDHENHATDSFARVLGVPTPLSDYKPFYHVRDEEKESAKKHLFKGRPNLVVHQTASAPNRNYPLALWQEVIVRLERAGWGILLVGKEQDFPDFPPHSMTPFIRDISKIGLSFRETAAVLSQSTAFVGVDSALVHLCHALDIPAVGIYGPFPWQIRTAKAPKTTAVSGTGECAPCFYHAYKGPPFPKNKPCSRQQVCTVLASITPDRICAKVALLKP